MTEAAQSHITIDDCIRDLAQLQEDYPNTFISRNYYRTKGSYSDRTWEAYFGTFSEFRKRAGLENTRPQHNHFLQIARHSSVDVYRDFFRDEVMPWTEKYPRVGKSKKIKTILCGSDFHDLESDPFVLSVFIDVAKQIQPDIILLNGDVFDNYEFSRFDKDPREIKIKERFGFVHINIFSALREVCPDAQIDYVMGNHSFRLIKHLADKSPNTRTLLSDVMGLSIADIFGVRPFEINLYSKVDLAAWNKNDIKEQLRQNYVIYYDCFVASHFQDFGFGMSGTSGHTHRPGTVSNRNLALGKVTWTVTGSIARPDAHYVENLSKAIMGFALFHIDTTNKTVFPENYIITGDFAAIAGRFYHRLDSH